MSRRPIAVVTGGAGFIGSHMVDLLVESGYQVRVIDDLCGGREANIAHHADGGQVEFEKRDIRSITLQDAFFGDVSYVFHFAGIGDIVPSIESPAEYMDVNVQGTVRVLEAARHNNVKKLVYAASSSCYGLADTPTDEQHVIRPQYPYALTKNIGEQLVMHWCQLYKLPAVSLRFFNVYGPRARTSGTYGAVFGVFLAQKLANKPYTVVGDGEQTRDFTYVTDIVNAIYTAVKSNITGEAINIGSNNTYSINQLVNLLDGEAINIPKRPGEPDCTWADITKAKKLLNWTPSVGFEEGVNMLINDIEYWSGAPIWDKDSIEKATEKWFEYLG